MKISREFSLNVSKRLIFLLTMLLAQIALGAGARASTATFTAPAALDPSEVAALSSDNDASGVFLGLGETLALVFDAPFATARGENVSIFTLRPDVGRARFRIRFGVFNDGAPTFVFTRNRNAGRNLSANNLFQRGCSAFGGCDYVEITLIRTRRGATGAEVDYVSVDGEVTQVASPTPEPAAWALMILGFSATALRLKAIRRRRLHPDKADWRYAAAETTLR